MIGISEGVTAVQDRRLIAETQSLARRLRDEVPSRVRPNSVAVVRTSNGRFLSV